MMHEWIGMLKIQHEWWKHSGVAAAALPTLIHVFSYSSQPCYERAKRKNTEQKLDLLLQSLCRKQPTVVGPTDLTLDKLLVILM